MTVPAGAPTQPFCPHGGSIWPGGACAGPTRTPWGQQGEEANRVSGDAQAFLPKAGSPPALPLWATRRSARPGPGGCEPLPRQASRPAAHQGQALPDPSPSPTLLSSETPHLPPEDFLPLALLGCALPITPPQHCPSSPPLPHTAPPHPFPTLPSRVCSDPACGRGLGCVALQTRIGDASDGGFYVFVGHSLFRSNPLLLGGN